MNDIRIFNDDTEIDFSNLIKHERSGNKGRFILSSGENIGKTIKFKRKHFLGHKTGFNTGEFKILNFIRNKRKDKINIVFDYKGKEYNIPWHQILNGNIGYIVDERNEFKLSDCGTYKIGITSNGVKFHYDIEDADKVELYVWYADYGISNRVISIRAHDGKRSTITLHSLVMNRSWIDHINNNPCDNRKNNLRYSDYIDNCRNLKTNRLDENNNILPTGLSKQGKSWCGRIRAEGCYIQTKLKTKEEALLDLLIAQRHFSLRHNEEMFYLIENIDKDRIDNVINLLYEKIENVKNKEKKSVSKYEFEYEEDFVRIYYNNKNKRKSFKVDVHTHLTLRKNGLNFSESGSGYIKCYGYINGKYTTSTLTRVILGINDDEKYIGWVIDHINHDIADNRRCNLVITDNKGNACNKKGVGYHKVKNKWRINYMIHEFEKYETYESEAEAQQEVERRRKIMLSQRLEFHSKEALDEYIENNTYLELKVV